MNKKDILLSVIIPCKNEEKHIEKCLHSVLKQTRGLQKTEIIVIDSFSTDKTLEKAGHFPVDIIQLRRNWFHSPAAARYVGCLNASGKYIFIIDADMELLPGFLKKGIDFLELNANVAGVAGVGSEVYEEGGAYEDLYKRKDHLQAVDFLGGAALYLNSALKAVGNFNPYLKAEEEAEISQRLKKAGYKLFAIQEPMTKHYTSQNMDNFNRRLKAGMFSGIGQMLRLTLEKRTFSLHLLARFKLLIVFVLSIAMLLSAIIFAFVQGSVSLLFFVTAFVFFLWLNVCIKRGLKRGTLSFYKSIRVNMQILKGLFKKTPEITTYPHDVVFIKRGKSD